MHKCVLDTDYVMHPSIQKSALKNIR